MTNSKALTLNMAIVFLKFKGWDLEWDPNIEL